MKSMKYTLNAIVHISQPFHDNWRHSGFKELSGAYTHWGVKVVNRYYAAIHYTEMPVTHVISGVEKTEQQFIDEGYIYPVMLVGLDDIVNMIRFKTQEERNAFITSDEPYDCYDVNLFGLFYDS